MNDVDSTCYITNVTGKNITNRLIKLHSAPNAIVDGWHFEKTAGIIPQAGGISSATVEAQQAPATILNGRIHFDGVWNNEIVRNHTDRGDYRYGGSITSNISALVENANDNSIVVVCLTSTAGNTGTTYPDSLYNANISNVVVEGTIKSVVSVNLRGSLQNTINISNVVANLSSGLIAASGASTAKLYVNATNILNVGTVKPITNGFIYSTRVFSGNNIVGFVS